MFEEDEDATVILTPEDKQRILSEDDITETNPETHEDN